MESINILKLRKSLKMTQLEFCNMFGISQPYLSEIENKKKPITEDLYNNLLSEFGKLAINEFIDDADVKNGISDDAEIIRLRNEIKLLKEELKESYKEIGRLEGENSILREQLNLGERKNNKSA